MTGDDDAEWMSEWRSNFRKKPGHTRPICSGCGDDWPCEFELEQRERRRQEES